MITSKLKVMTIVGTRPEIIKMSAIIKKCDKYFEHVLVHTGQNYDYTLNEVFFKDLGLRAPDYYLNVVGGNLGQTMGNVIAKAYDLLEKVCPDAVIVLGDTNSCLSVIAAKRLKIPIFHMEAGNRCKDEYTFVVGSPMAEVLSSSLAQIEKSTIMEELHLKPQRYILLSAHREENIDIESNFFSLMNAINALAEKYDMPILYSCHPRSQKYIAQRHFQFDSRVIQHKPLGFFDYNHLQQNAYCVVSDSGTLPEEGAFFNFPAVSIRTSTERPEAMDKGVFVIGSITSEQVVQAVDLSVKMWRNGDMPSAVPSYATENVSTKVVKIIQSYTGIVNRMVWRKF